MRYLLLFTCVVCAALFATSANGQTLVAGDIAFTGYNFDNPDEFSFVATTDITAGEQINFTDCGWLSSGGFRSGEGTIKWTCPAGGITCGTEVTITDNSPFSASTGTVTDAASMAFSGSGDQIIAFQGTFGSPTPIAAVHSDGTTWSANATNSNNSALPTGLTDGTHAIAISETDNAKYDCSTTTGSSATLLGAINDNSNWSGSNTTRQTLPVNCPISCNLQSVSTSAIAGSPFCVTVGSGQAVSIPFTSVGTYNGPNVYTAELSDAVGDFSAPTSIGTLNSTANSGTISATIPAGTASGSGYRIRVTASDPATVGSDNGSDLEIILGLSDVSGQGSTAGNAQVDVSWTNPAGCFDEVLVVGIANASVTAIPSGDGTAYTANAAFGSGTDLGGSQFAVYKGSGTSVSVTGLTNGDTYCFKVYTRSGTDWSTGVETCAIPNTSTTFSRGDLAILAVNANNNACSGNSGEDIIRFVCFRDITNGTEIEFTDNGYERCNTDEWGNTEGTIRATRTGGTISAGTIITFTADGTGTYTSTAPDASWTFTEINFSSNFNLNNGGDQIYFMQGGTWNQGTSNNHDATYTGGEILFGFTTNNTWSASCGSTQHSNLFPFLGCFSMGPTSSADFNKYTGPVTAATRGEWISRINDTINWSSYANCSDFNSMDLLPATITITAGGWQDGVWTGANDADWFECGNWQALEVPVSSTDVSIPSSGVTNEPTIGAAGATCNDLTISSGRTLTIDDASSTLQLNGDFTLDGDLAHTNGTVTLDSIASTVNGSVTPVFFNLVIDKDVATETVTLNRSLSVSNDLTFTTGRFMTDASNFVIIQDDATVTGASNNSYVDGPIEKIGDDAFTFPTGNNGDLQPISISAPTGANTDAFKAQYFQDNPNISVGSVMEPGIDHVSACEYWVLDQSVGTPTAEVSLGWDANSCGVTDLCELLVARWDGSTWRNHGNGGTTGNTATGTVVSGSACTTPAEVTTFSPFTLASTTANNPLPITLLHFDAYEEARQVQLRWATASETNNDYFAIERSTDGFNFETITEVPGAGWSQSVLNYETVDPQPPLGIIYYRLRQVDFDLRSTVTSPIAVEIGSTNGLDLDLWTQSGNNSQIMFSTNELTPVTIEVISSNGQVVYRKVVSGSERYTESLQLENLAVGLYNLRLLQGEQVIHQKIVLR